MRFRTRGILMPSRQDIIVKVEADDVYAAAAQAGKMIRDSGQVTMALISALSVKPMKSSKSSVYVGAPRQKRGKPGRKANSNGTPAAAAVETPAAVTVETPAAVTVETPAAVTVETPAAVAVETPATSKLPNRRR